MTTNLRKQKTITAIFWSVIAVMLLAMGIYAIRDLPMRLAMKVSPSIHLAIEMSTDNSVYKTVFKNYGNETLDPNINRTIEDGNKITLTGDIFNNIYSNEPLYLRITNYTQASDVNDTINYSNGPALSAYFSAENGVTNYPSYGVQNITPYDGTTLHSKTFVVIPQSVLVDSSYEFNLKLELSNFVSTEYVVTQTLATGITSLNNFADTKAIMGHDFETTLTTEQANSAIAITSVKVNNVDVANSLFTFDNLTGVFLLKQEAMIISGSNYYDNTATIAINAELKPNSISVLVNDHSIHGSTLSINGLSKQIGTSFIQSTKNDLVLKIHTQDGIMPKVTIGGVASTNFDYNYLANVMTISKESMTGNVVINLTNYWDGTIATSFAGGDGSVANPFKITNAEHLALLAYVTNNYNALTTYNNIVCANSSGFGYASYEMLYDVYLNDETFTCNTTTGYVTITDGTNSIYVGNGLNSTTMGSYYSYNGTTYTLMSTQPTKTTATSTQASYITYGTSKLNVWSSIRLSGIFNGNNNYIKHAYFNDITRDNLGVFGGLYGNISNTLSDNNVMIGSAYIGGLVGTPRVNSILKNCGAINNIVMGVGANGPGTQVGGLVGSLVGDNVKLSNSYAVNCYSISNGTANSNYVAGLCGLNYKSINNCYSGGEILSNTGSATASVCGNNSLGIINYSYCANGKIFANGGTTPNSGYFDASDAKKTLTADTTINGISCSTLTDALNAWVNGNPDYSRWAIDQTGKINGGYPYFV